MIIIDLGESMALFRLSESRARLTSEGFVPFCRNFRHRSSLKVDVLLPSMVCLCMTDTARGKPEGSEAGTVFFLFSSLVGVDCKHQVVVVSLDTPRLPATLSNARAGGVWFSAGVQGKSLSEHLILPAARTLDDRPPGSLGVQG